MIVTARLDFSAAHRLNNPPKDAESNRRVLRKGVTIRARRAIPGTGAIPRRE